VGLGLVCFLFVVCGFGWSWPCLGWGRLSGLGWLGGLLGLCGFFERASV